LQKNKTLERKNGSGKVAKKFKSKVIKAIKNKFDQTRFENKHVCSQRTVDSKFNITQLYVCKILKESSDINCYKKYKRSLMNAEQKKSLRPKCKQLVEKNCGYKFIIDDESYFTLLHTTLPRNVCFYSNNFQLMPDNVKYKYQAKCKSKLKVWIAISPSGISKPCFSQSGLAVNQEVYKNCLQTYLIPFIKKYHSMIFTYSGLT
jgi:hypothetical protein